MSTRDKISLGKSRARTTIVLPVELRKNKYDYKLFQRGNKACIYKQMDNGKVIGYEVFLIKYTKARLMPNGDTISAHEKFPGNEDFGKTAWSCKELERAIKRFLHLEEKP